MEHVLRVVDEWRNRIEDHPLHRWLATDDDLPPEHRLWFALYFTNFIMYFREMNLYHISYGERRGLDRHREAISAHADEDMTHSRLFMRDFATLGWDDLLDWRPSEVLHWLFSSEVTEGLRRRTTALAKLVIEADDPAVRYAVVESIETCGNALFRHTTEAAGRYERRTGRRLVYWGEFHLARETGHAVDDDAFDGLELTPVQRRDAVRRVERVFELIDEQNSEMLTLAQETVSQGGFAARTARHATPPREVPAVDPPARDSLLHPTETHPAQRPILDALHRAVAGLPRFEEPDDIVERLRRTLLFNATDTLGSISLYRYMISYPWPVDAAERALNRLAVRLGGRADSGVNRRSLFYVDWASLELDETLGWSPSRMLEFIYLDAATEPWRDLRAVATHHIDSTRNPVVRYWTIVAMKSLNAAHAEPTAALARVAERQLGRPLPYLTLKLTADRPGLEPDPEADAIRFADLPVDADVVDRAVTMIEELAHAFRCRQEALMPTRLG
ncbi:hypothetical protein [Kutzneria chonburiensis]|uniref:Uncharacterized protein n=1 Tax=Kutzneria chonburiensis TaxID=1483604 RepID=A0ABV6MX67_9PSEU|nr:hypothetical protein [Kutzneria chonburiensis]